jgi:hypothetical protein
VLIYGVRSAEELEEVRIALPVSLRGIKRKGRAWQFALVSTQWKARRGGRVESCACWYCHKLFFDRLFDRFPDSRVVTTGAHGISYRNREDYLQQLATIHPTCRCHC